MSDEADRPLTRRERRLREQAEAGAASAVAEAERPAEHPGEGSGEGPAGGAAAARADAGAAGEGPIARRASREEGAAPSQGPAPEAAAAPADPASSGAADDDIEISPFNEDGTPRTRREIRALREEALAARAAAQSAAAASVEPVETAGAEPAEAAAASPSEAIPIDAETAEPAPTVPEPPAPFEPPADSASEETDPRLSATQPLSLEDIVELAGGEPAEPEPEAPAGLEPIAADPAPAELVEAEPEEAVPAEPEPVEAERVEPEPEAAAPEPPSYSFPDIAPLDDNISVFDDPATRTVATPIPAGAVGDADGDFDDLISRAVAQEGAAGTTNSSALILPTLPDTGDLSGPLGGTGDLLVTGSLDLPKSLGETGGHAPLHDALDVDPIDELGFETMPATGDPILPVSAARAVSAVGAEGPVVAQQTKEKSKLPLALILTGGGLLIAVAGLVAWGATSGIFG